MPPFEGTYHYRIAPTGAIIFCKASVEKGSEKFDEQSTLISWLVEVNWASAFASTTGQLRRLADICLATALALKSQPVL